LRADPVLRSVLEDVAVRAHARALERDDRLARAIIADLAEALSK
jgi:hypothetical protein